MKEKKRRQIRVRLKEKKVRTKIKRDLFNSFGGKKERQERRRFPLKRVILVQKFC